MYVRVSENCNSHCFMCHYAGTNNALNISYEQYDKLLNHMKKNNYKMIRFTGGEHYYIKILLTLLKELKRLVLKHRLLLMVFYYHYM